MYELSKFETVLSVKLSVDRQCNCSCDEFSFVPANKFDSSPEISEGLFRRQGTD